MGIQIGILQKKKEEKKHSIILHESELKRIKEINISLKNNNKKVNASSKSILLCKLNIDNQLEHENRNLLQEMDYLKKEMADLKKENKELINESTNLQIGESKLNTLLKNCEKKEKAINLLEIQLKHQKIMFQKK